MPSNHRRPFWALMRACHRVQCAVQGHRWSVGESFHVGAQGFGEYDECDHCDAERLSRYRGNTNDRDAAR